MDKKIICIDFDGTCVSHVINYSTEIGKDIGAQSVLKEMTKNGHKLILHTVRQGRELKSAVNWFNKNKVPLYFVWEHEGKPYADLYIDDRALGAPTIHPDNERDPIIDWIRVKELLQQQGILN